MSKKLNFVFGGKEWKFQLQDKAQRVEELGETFNKLTVTPQTPNGEVLRLELNTFLYQVQRQYTYGLVDEFLTPTYNPLAFPYNWKDERRVIGEWGYLDASLIDVSGPSTYIDDLEIADGKTESFNIANPFVRHQDTKIKTVRVTSDFVKLVKLTNTLFQGRNDSSFDEDSGLPNASLKLFARQRLAAGAVIEVYPTVVVRNREDGSKWLGNRLQLTVEKLWEWMNEIHNDRLDIDTAAAQYYSAKALRTQHYRNLEANKANGSLTDDIQDKVNEASRQFALGEAVEEFGLKIKLEGEVVDVSTIPAGNYSATPSGRKLYFNTSLRAGRFDLTLAAQQHHLNVDLQREADDFVFPSL